MIKIKFCGISRFCDIEVVNEIKPEYIGFVFTSKSKRFITFEHAAALKNKLIPQIQAIGVFVDEEPLKIANLLNQGIIDIAQLHGKENEQTIKKLKQLTDKPIIKAFCIEKEKDITNVESCSADYVLLDSGGGTGTVFHWELIKNINRPYILAGGLNPQNVKSALNLHNLYAVDVSSGIETNGLKDKVKMAEFIGAVRKEKI